MLSTARISALLIVATCLPEAAPGQVELEVPRGFSVTRLALDRHSYLNLAFDAAGGMLLATETAGLLRATDPAADGSFQDVRSLLPDLLGVQGLCAEGDSLFAIGRRGGRSALWRITLTEDGSGAGAVVEVLSIDDVAEHGAHAVVVGPGGELFVAIGDQARFEEGPEDGSWIPQDVAPLLPVLTDPGGFGARSRFPFGFIARVDPVRRTWRYHSVGYRNHYDIAFDVTGDLFTCDSDMELDVGLPWYRPVRVLLCNERTDYGSRMGSAIWPAYTPEIPPAIAELGRGSPTGICVYEHDLFPDRYHGALLLADWTNANVRALFLEPDGSGYTARVETLVQAKGALNITDLAVGPDGALYFVTGGRGTAGAVYRLAYGREEPLTAPGDALERALRMPQPRSSWARATLAEFARDEGDARADELRGAALDPARTARERIAALTVLDLGGAATPLEALAQDPDEDVRAWVTRGLARSREMTSARLDLLLAHLEGRPSRTRRVAQEALKSAGNFPPDDPWTVAQSRPYADPNILQPSYREIVGELALAPPDIRTGLFALRWMARERGHQLLAEIAPVLLERFPRGEQALDRELARTIARAAPAGSIDALLAALDRTPSRADAIHYAYCLRAIESGWDDARLARFFAWFEEAAAWSGGGNFQGYLDAMLNEVVDRVAVRTAQSLSARGELGPRALATFLARKDPAQATALFEPLQAAFAALDDEENVFLAMQQKRQLLQATSGSRVAGVAAWVRAVYGDEPRLRGQCLLLLAPAADETDWERFVKGLEHGDRDVREACIAALLRTERKAQDARTIRSALDQARARGSRGGRKILRVVSFWTGRSPGPADGEWSSELLEWERWFTRTFPEFSRPDPREARPHWDFDRTLAFLERTEDRPASRSGSAARGEHVFEKATCITCHTMAGTGSGWGPDLTDVAGRFERRALLEAIAFPSRVIADRYHVTRVTRHSGEELEGRLVEDAPDRIVLLRTNGTRVTVARADTTFVGPSEVSAMPEGLLDALTLEEVKDLFAYMTARGDTTPEQRAEPGWLDALGDSERRFWGGTFAGWRLSGGTLVGRAKNLPRSTYITYGRELSDFELEFDVRAVRANTGVQYRSKVVPGEVHPIGYQADIGKAFWGALYATDGRGLLARPEAKARDAAVEYDGWNHYYVRAEGDRHVIEVNGHPMVDVRDDAHASGVFALQLHQKLDMTVSFANLRVRPLR